MAPVKEINKPPITDSKEMEISEISEGIIQKIPLKMLVKYKNTETTK